MPTKSSDKQAKKHNKENIKIFGLIVYKNDFQYLNSAIKSLYNFCDQILIIDNDSSDYFNTTPYKKLICRRKSGSLIECLNYGIKIIREIEPKSYIFRLDADEIFIKSKININHLKKFIFDNNVKAFSIERDIYYKNKPISNDLKQDVIRLFSCHLEYENSLVMDEFINSNCVNIKFLKILDLRNSSISEHFERHLIYANRECENYFKNKVTNFRNFKKKKKIYYKFPFFFRSIIFGFFSLFMVSLNKNFLYNFKYQIIRTLIYRVYVDYLILKKK